MDKRARAEGITAHQRADDEFAIARARAINAYAELEMSLALLFQRLLDADIQKSFAVFAAILNSRARLRLIGSLLQISFGEKFDAFFESLIQKLEGIDATRNKIAHWIVLHSSTGGKEFDPKKDIALNAHPNMFNGGKLYKHEIIYFERQTKFYSQLVHRFSMAVKFPESMDDSDPPKDSWKKVFSEKVSYPPADSHPLSTVL